MAPSCSGEFLKKMFITRRRLISASKRSPVAIISSRAVFFWITMRAPVCSAAMARTASESSTTEREPILSSLMPSSRLNKSPVRLAKPELMASLLSIWRISGWKRMMMASTPTSRRVFSSTVIMRMLSALTTACSTSRTTSTSTILSTVESPRMLRMRK